MAGLANIGELEKWWGYLGEQGYNEVERAGVMANIYAESRGNPGAVNPDDGGMESMGAMQWRGSRNSALRAFAQDRGTAVNTFDSQAPFLMSELRGSESQNAARAFDGATTPGEAATGFAQHVVRPAAEHIPQRAGYADQIYGHFTGQDIASPQLSYDPQQGEDLSRQSEAVAENGGAFSYGLPPAQTGSDQMEAVRRAANPQMYTPQAAGAPLRTGPTQEVMPPAPNDALEYLLGNKLKTSPDGGETDLTPEQRIDEMFPVAAAGEAPTSQIITGFLSDTASQSAFNLGVPVEDAPTTISEVISTASEPVPTEEEDSSEAGQKKRNRFMVASDMLAVLSQGLGQMSAGNAVDVSSTLQAQSARNMQMEEQQREAEAAAKAVAQQRVQAGQLSQQLVAMGKPGLAQMALSGEEGMKTAMQAYQTIQSRAPSADSAVSGFAAMSVSARTEYLAGLGLDPQAAEAGAMNPDIGERLIEELVKPDPKAASDAAASAAGLGMLAVAAPLMGDNPAMTAAFNRVAANPGDTSAQTSLQSLLTDVGADLPAKPPAAAAINAFADSQGLPQDHPLRVQALAGNGDAWAAIRDAAVKGLDKGAEVTAENSADTATLDAQINDGVRAGLIDENDADTARALGGIGPMLELVGKTQQKAQDSEDRARVAGSVTQLADAYGPNADAVEAILTGAQTIEELNARMKVVSAQFAPTDRTQFLNEIRKDPSLLGIALEVERAGSGTENAMDKGMAGILIDEYSSNVTTLTSRRPLVGSMNEIINQIGAADYDRSSGQLGPLTPLYQKVGSIARQLGFEVDPEGGIDPTAFISRYNEASRGEFFQNFRLAGSGATSDKESSNFEIAMPAITDDAIKAMGMAQRIVRGQKVQQLVTNAQSEWMQSNSTNPSKLHNREEMTDFIQSKVDAANVSLFPEVVVGKEGWAQQMTKDMASGNIDRTTIIRYTAANGQASYGMAGDVMQTLLPPDQQSLLPWANK